MNLKEKIKKIFCLEEDKEIPYTFNQSILREYDIRGIFGETLFVKDAFNIGRAYGTILNKSGLKKICIGCDCRNSSNELYESLLKGLINTGIDVVSIGICHTPLVYYAVHKYHLDGGIMITGSHNSAQYNGFKIMIGENPFYGSNIKELGNLIENQCFVDGNGREIIVNNIMNDYVNDILYDFKFLDNDIKIAWDIGNGATSLVIKSIITKLSGKHHMLFDNMDGNFPNRGPDPIKHENISELCKFVEYNNFDIGFAFDSDGDRLCIVNSKGKPLYSDQSMCIFVEDFLKKNPGAQVIADVKSCNDLFNTIKKYDGIGIMEKVGHSFIKTRMKATGALLAAEVSGHFFFKDRWFGFDDGVYAALRAMEIMINNRNAFNEIKESIVTPEIRIPCAEELKTEIIDFLKKQLTEDKNSFIAIDGVRVSNEIGWWILRPSNTESVLSLRIEADTEENMVKLISMVENYLVVYISNIRDIIKLSYN